MRIRETLNQNPRITTAVTLGLVLIAALVIVWQLWPESQPAYKAKVFYTEDDGATWFIGDHSSVPPFTGPNGRPAVRARVFECGRRTPQFIGYLEKYDDTAKQALDAFYSNPKNKDKKSPEQDQYDQNNVLVKKPKSTEWVHIKKDAARAIIAGVKCADGTKPREMIPQVLEE